MIDFNADVTLLHGDNGTGKSSITEAITWGLTGTLPPELTDRAKGSRPLRDVIENAYSEGPSRVALTFKSEAGQIEVVRRGTSRSSEVQVVTESGHGTGEQAVATAFGCDETDELVHALATSAVLRQDAIRAAIDVGPATLHGRLASILGLDEITRFTTAAKDAVKEARAAEREAKDRYEAATSNVRDASDAITHVAREPRVDERALINETLTTELLTVRGDVTYSVEEVTTLDDLVRSGRLLNSLIEQVDMAASLFDQEVQTASEVGVSPGELEPRWQSAALQAESLEKMASSNQRLVQSALELLGDHCPVCRQAVDQQELRARLQLDLEAGAENLQRADEARKYAASLRVELETSQRQEATLETRQMAVRSARSELTEAAGRSQVAVPEEFFEPKSWRLLSNRLSEIRTVLRRAHAVVHEQVAADVDRLRGVLLKAQEESELAANAHQATQVKTRRAVALSDAAQTGADQLVASWLERLAPSFSEVFDRLQPHPTFTTLQFKPDIYYKKNVVVPEVFDPAVSISANPLVTFSEGQLNAVALSYFLGMALNTPDSPFAFLLLDDPLQSMDVISALGFADLCRRLRSERQLILTTHDRRWAEVLMRKLSPRVQGTKTIINELQGWTREGPTIKRSIIDYQGEERIAT